MPWTAPRALHTTVPSNLHTIEITDTDFYPKHLRLLTEGNPELSGLKGLVVRGCDFDDYPGEDPGIAQMMTTLLSGRYVYKVKVDTDSKPSRYKGR